MVLLCVQILVHVSIKEWRNIRSECVGVSPLTITYVIINDLLQINTIKPSSSEPCLSLKRDSSKDYHCTRTALHEAQRYQSMCFPSKSQLILPLPVTVYAKCQSVEQFVVSSRCCPLPLAYTIRDALQPCIESSIAAAAAADVVVVVAWRPAYPISCHTGLHPSLTEP